MEGVRRGHNLDLMLPQTFSKAKVDWADLAVLSNCVTFPRDQLSYVTLTKPYMFFTHDYYFCFWRDYLSLTEKCFKCKLLPFWRELYLKSRLNVFLSPLHFEMHQIVLPDLKDHPHMEIPSPIDTNLFKPVEGVKREANTVLYVGPFCRYKGIHLALAYAEAKKEFQYTFVGVDIGGVEEPWREKIEAMGHKVLGGMPNETLPELYSRFEYFLELPAGPMPFERVVAESFLCGAKLILNKNVGFASWNFKDREECRKAVSQSATKFWEAVEKHA